MLALLVLSAFALTFKVQKGKSEPKTWFVDDDGPADFHTIKEAIKNASTGDTIFVRNGIYNENVVVNKTVSLTGENRSNAVIGGNGNDTGILITADHVTIQGFGIQNCEVGIKVESNDNIISSNLISSNGYYETEILTNQEIYQDYVSPLSRWYLHNLINGSYTGFFNITGHTPAISVQALGHEDVNQLGIALFHDKNEDHEPQLHEYVSYGDVKEQNVQVFLVNPPTGHYIIKVLGWEVPEDPGHFDLEITEYTGYGIEFLSSRNSIIDDNLFTQNPVGLYLHDSYNATIRLNTAIENVGGIVLSNSTQCIISNNNASLNKFGFGLRQFGIGMTLWSVQDSYISENNVSLNTFGIWLLNSSNNELVGNSLLLNAGWGLGLYASHENVVSFNNMSLTTGLDGVRMSFASQNNITQNYISNNNHAGIFLWLDNDNNSITGNKFYSNGGHGIELKFSDNNTIADNEALYNGVNGILIIESTGCTVRDNLVLSNPRGMMFYDAFGNAIYHNSVVGNWEQPAWDGTDGNFWDNGYPDGGNYWSGYEDVDQYSGPYQNETGSDGIWDHPYGVSVNNQDNYPLKETLIPLPTIPGDINGDGFVEMMDYWVISQAYGSQPGDPNWNPDADINGDGMVELTDFWIISQHFGETW
jgi:parallel beta-helix repeat protein